MQSISKMRIKGGMRVRIRLHRITVLESKRISERQSEKEPEKKRKGVTIERDAKHIHIACTDNQISNGIFSSIYLYILHLMISTIPSLSSSKLILDTKY